MLLGRSVESCMCKCEKCENVRIMLKELKNVCVFSNCTEREDIVVSQDDHALYLFR